MRTKKSKEEIRKIRKKWYNNNLNKMKEYRGEYRKNNKDLIYLSQLLCKWKRKYNITSRDYFVLLGEQDLKCAICSQTLYPFDKKTCIDHNHNTNKVRGLLCPRCNLFLGMIKDDIKLLDKAIVYLKKYHD